MIHVIENEELATVITVDETLSNSIRIEIQDGELFVSHLLDSYDAENLIDVLKYVIAKKKKIHPNTGRRVSALSLDSIRVKKQHNGGR